MKILLISNCDSLAQLVTRNLPLTNVEIVGVVKCKPSFKKKINILSSAIKKNSLWYAIYMQLEVLLTKYLVFFSKVGKNNVLSIKTNLFVTSNLEDQGVLGFVKSCNADLILSIRPSFIFPLDTITKFPPIVNLHCSLLPAFGGIGAVLQALCAGEEKLGISFHLVESQKIDDGLVVYQDCIDRCKDKSVFWHTFMLYYEAGLILPQKIQDIFLNVLDRKELSSKKIAKSYFSWPSQNCFKKLHGKGFSLLSIKDFKVKI